MAGWQLEPVSQSSCLYCFQPSVWAEKRAQRCACCTFPCCPFPSPTRAKLWERPSEPVAHSAFWVATSVPFRHSSLSLKTQRHLQQREENSLWVGMR